MSPYGQHKLMMEQLCRSYGVTFGSQYRGAVVLGLRTASAQAIAVGYLFPAATGRTDAGLGGTGAEIARLDRCARRGSVAGDNRRTTAAGDAARYQWRVRSRHERRGNRTMLVKNWDGDVAVRYSGIVRAGDPFSLLADDAGLRQLPFDWRISIEQGIVDYVKWFKDQLRD